MAADDTACALGNYFEDAAFHVLVAMMNDVYAIVNRLSMALQASTMPIVEVTLVVSAKITVLNCAFPDNSKLHEASTPSLRALLSYYMKTDKLNQLDVSNTYSAGVSYVKRLVEKIELRFPKETQKVVHELEVLYL